jgi:hypothetical protein
MSRTKPNINIANASLPGDRAQLKSLILTAITDTFIYQYTPNEIQLDETGNLFTLYLYNKHLIEDILQIDDYSQYVDVYLFGVKQPNSRYSVTFNDTDIIIKFNVGITRLPADVLNTDFLIKGKIAVIE